MLPVTASFQVGPPGTELSPRETLWSVPIGPAAALFLLLVAIDHLLMAASGVWPWYAANLRRGINYARWWEYSVSASIMIVLIALVTGVSDVGAVAVIFGIKVAMIFFGLTMEIFNRPERRVTWTPFQLGCLAGIVPWLIIAYQVIGRRTGPPATGCRPSSTRASLRSSSCSTASPSTWSLQSKRVGPWRDYLFGEQAYVVRSRTAKTALAWQVFANTLIDSYRLRLIAWRSHAAAPSQSERPPAILNAAPVNPSGVVMTLRDTTGHEHRLEPARTAASGAMITPAKDRSASAVRERSFAGAQDDRGAG